jgi:hypothetical protein
MESLSLLLCFILFSQHHSFIFSFTITTFDTRVDTYDGLNYMSCSSLFSLFNCLPDCSCCFPLKKEMRDIHAVNNHAHHLQTFRTNLSPIPSLASPYASPISSNHSERTCFSPCLVPTMTKKKTAPRPTFARIYVLHVHDRIC